jgi:hypothetical protein
MFAKSATDASLKLQSIVSPYGYLFANRNPSIENKMAAFTKLFLIGPPSNTFGEQSDGPHQLDVEILLGEGSRQWYEARYFTERLGPIGDVKVFVPETPDDVKSLLDACIVFVASQFRSCPSFAEADLILKGVERLDFGEAPESVPVIWKQLRREALPLFRKLPVFETSLTLLDLSEEHFDCDLDA